MTVPTCAPVDTDVHEKGFDLSKLAGLFEMIGGYTVEERLSYNAELDQFFSEYRSYLKRTVTYLDLQARTIALNILVYNDGTAPGEDIDIHLYLPDGFTLQEEMPNEPAKPEPPKAQTAIEKLQESLRTPYINASVLHPRTLGVDRPSGPPNVSRPNIRRTKSYEVGFRIGRLKQNTPIYLDRLFVIFESLEHANSFGVEYRINAGNVPHEIKGTLHVIIESAEGDTAKRPPELGCS